MLSEVPTSGRSDRETDIMSTGSSVGLGSSVISLCLEVFNDLGTGPGICRKRDEKDFQEKKKGAELCRSCPRCLILPHPNSRKGKLGPA